MSAGLYIHIPFCLSKCKYCDFYSIPRPHPQFDDYLSALIAEIHHRAADYRDENFVSLYFGGGTPSLFGARRIEAILECAAKYLHLDPDPEITIEINPASCSEHEVRDFKAAGVNRASIGLQSLNDDDLQRLGRPHSADAGKRMFDICRQAGFENISVDFIHSLPWRQWQTEELDLNRILELEPEHLSAYSLTIEQGTEFGRLKEAGQLDELAPDEAANRIMSVNDLLQSKGLMRYEISNFARGAHRCRHNLIYWQGGNYLGIGASACSYLTDNATPAKAVRQQNISDHRLYVFRAGSDAAVEMSEEIDDRKALTETIMLQLRLADGIVLSDFEQWFGRSQADQLKRLAQTEPLNRFLDCDNRAVQLKPLALPLADEIALRLCTALENS